MANITPSFTRVVGSDGLDGWQIQWGPMANGDIGLEVGSVIGDGAAAIKPAGSGSFLSGFADKSVQAVGTFGTGGSVAIEGTNDGSHFFALTNPAQVIIALTSATPGSAVTEAIVSTRPHVTAGDGTTALTVTMFCRKTHSP
jgi:hypothetical protein